MNNFPMDEQNFEILWVSRHPGLVVLRINCSELLYMEYNRLNSIVSHDRDFINIGEG